MIFRDFSRYFEKGYDILIAFRDKGLTPYQARVLIELYKSGGEVLRERLKEAACVANSSQLSGRVIHLLIESGYMKRGKKGKDGRVSYSMLPEGSKLVEEVIKETGY